MEWKIKSLIWRMEKEKKTKDDPDLEANRAKERGPSLAVSQDQGTGVGPDHVLEKGLAVLDLVTEDRGPEIGGHAQETANVDRDLAGVVGQGPGTESLGDPGLDPGIISIRRVRRAKDRVKSGT